MVISGALIVSILLAASALAAAYALAALWVRAAVILPLAIPWLLARQSSRAWIPSLSVAVLALAAALGALLDLDPRLLVIGLTATLSAWNLDAFARRLESVDRVEQEQALQHRHLRRLLIVDGLGLLSATLALRVRVNLSFALGLALALIAIVGLSRAISFLARDAGS